MLAVDIPITWEPDKPFIPVVDNPEMRTLSPSFNGGDVEIWADTVPLFQTKTTSSKVSIVVSIEVISLPDILSTETLNPPPFVFVLSNIAESPTSYPSPLLITLIELIDPEVVLSTSDVCVVISLDSIIKSLSAYWSDTLYGYVFLTKLVLLNSNVFWLTLKFSITGSGTVIPDVITDLYVFPIKYGNLGRRELVVIPAK